MARAKRKPAPETCPVCGEDVPRNALACPECGADHESGWREEAGSIDALGAGPVDDFDYEELAEREFGGQTRQVKPPGIAWFWWLVAALLVGALLYGWLGAAFLR